MQFFLKPQTDIFLIIQDRAQGEAHPGTARRKGVQMDGVEGQAEQGPGYRKGIFRPQGRCQGVAGQEDGIGTEHFLEQARFPLPGRRGILLMVRYDTPENYRKRYYKGELPRKQTFENRVLSPEPKFVQKKRQLSDNKSTYEDVSTFEKEIPEKS